LGTIIKIYYNKEYQAANKLAGLCPYCAHYNSDIDVHYLECPKLELISIMESYNDYDGWKSRYDNLVIEMMESEYYKDKYKYITIV